MNTPIFKDKEFKSDDPTQAFRVPQGYFDQLYSDLMGRIEEEEASAQEALRKRSTLDVLRPYLYLAAMFVGLAMIINLIPYVKKFRNADATSNLATAVSMEALQSFDITDEEYELFLWEEMADEVIASSISDSY